LQLTGKCLQLTGKCLQLTGKCLQLTGKCLQLTGKCLQLTGKRLQLTSKCGLWECSENCVKSGNIQKTVLYRAETIDFSLPKPGFTQKTEQSRCP
jgi:hypothetical protein